MSESSISEARRQDQPEPIDLIPFLRNFWRLLRRLLVPVTVITVLAGAVAGFRAYRSYSPRYQAQAVLSATYVGNRTSGVDITNFNTYYSSTTSTKQLISTFSSILSTDAMREQLQKELGTSVVNGSVQASNIANSNLFTLTVTSSDPQDAYDVLMAVVHCYPTVAQQVVGNTEIEIIDEPTVPAAPANSPAWHSAALKGALLVLLIQLCLIAALGQMQKLIHGPEEVRRFTNLPCLGNLPVTSVKKRSAGKGKGKSKKTSAGISILGDGTPSGYTEAVHTVRTRLMRQTGDGSGKAILVTSTLPGEGKSTVAANLALALAQTGSRVILVDADLRVQTLYEFFDQRAGGHGLAELLRSENAVLQESLQPVQGSSMKLISSSRHVNNPASLLRGARIQRVMKELREQADYVVVDTPPIGTLSDATAFLPYVDGVVYVIRSECVTGTQVANGIQAVSDSGTPLYGYVFNCVPASGSQYGYGRYGYRKYGYGSYANRHSHYADSKE